MKFCEYPDNWKVFTKHGLAEQFGVSTREGMYNVIHQMSKEAGYSLGARHAWFDQLWHQDEKPYYDVYPSIIPMLIKLRLDLKGEHVKPPRGLRHLLLRLPEGQTCLARGDVKVRSIFMSFQTMNREAGLEPPVPTNGLVVGLDIGERDDPIPIPIHTIRAFPLDERNVIDCLDALRTHPSSREGIVVPSDLINDCVRLAITLCLLDDDPELISPDVLNRDKDKFDDADDGRKLELIARAKRNGKFAFVVGKGIEVIPHLRRPHPCLFWTGPNRTIPIIKKRKGSLIHRDKIEQIPTGHEN